MKVKCTEKTLLFIFVDIILILLCVIIESLPIRTIALVCVWMIGMIYSLYRIRDRFTLFSFHIGFFLFLIGGFFIYYLHTGTFQYFRNEYSTISHTLLSMMLSLSVINISYRINNDSRQISIEDDKEKNEESDLIPGRVKHVIVALLIISFIFKLITEVIKTSYILSTSYLSSTIEIERQLPGIIVYTSSLFYPSIFIFWSTKPNKQKTILSMIGVLLIAIIILVSGERGEPLSLLLTMIFYVLCRRRSGLDDIKIKKRWIIVGVLLLPMLFTYLQTLSHTRMNQEYVQSAEGAVYDFFESQGVSVRVISNGYDVKEDIARIGGHTYILGELRNYLKHNVFSRLLLGIKDDSLLEAALSGDRYSSTYNYLTLSSVSFNNGIGSGTSYIAESYHDGGYVLLLLASIGLALLISYIDDFSYRTTLMGSAIRLCVFQYIVLEPRGYLLSWLTGTFAIQNLVLFLIIYLLQKQKAS